MFNLDQLYSPIMQQVWR